MNAQAIPIPDPKKGGPISQQVALKIGSVFAIALVLLIPLSMIQSTLEERLSRRNEAVADITSSWGKEQVLVGPILVIPYRHTYKSFKDTVIKGEIKKTEVLETATARAWFLPDELKVEGDIQPEKLHRGIYEAVVYRGRLKLSGHFSPPDFQALKIDGTQVLWDDAVVAVGVTDLRGTGEALQIFFGDKPFRMAPGTGLDGLAMGVRAPIGSLSKSLLGRPFSLDMGFKGSGGINFAPVGIQNSIKLGSPWPDPSFKGQFLPAERSVTPQGFNALWKVSYYGRSYPQSSGAGYPSEQVQGSLFGVSFYNAVDSYRKVERAIKYGILFLTLVFAVFFLFETLASLRIHPVQYVLVGAAMCLFYLALLSLSEFMSFGGSYFVACAAAILVITLYSRAVLHSGAKTLVIGAELCAIYGFLYVALQLQDYSLLLGTVGLFAVLSAIMYATRDLDWYNLEVR
ncbi:MAG: cell envelope integrity protein CreD [Elusimicrobia bacterium]|nr:cell envelope integrity protein CreD [Elusimicrobiota bacterium]